MEFHFKVTVWMECRVPENWEKCIAQKIEDGLVNSTDDVYHLIEDIGNLAGKCQEHDLSLIHI